MLLIMFESVYVHNAILFMHFTASIWPESRCLNHES